MKRRNGFTLIELLVVVAIIALLVSILMPALGRARELANQVKCGTQLNGIGKAIALYCNDYKEAHPTICTSSLASVPYFWGSRYAETNPRWYNGAPNDPWDKRTGNLVSGTRSWMYPTVGGCLYLLVRYEDLVPNMFLCPSADYGEEMELQDATAFNIDVENWSDCIDFHTLKNLCYSAHDPFNRRLDASSTSSMPVMADMSPVTDVDLCTGPGYAAWDGKGPNTGDDAKAGLSDFNPDWTDADNSGVPAQWRPGNSPNHSQSAQNILFADSHVKKEDKPNVGIQDDNIYTHWVPGVATTVTGVTNLQIGRVDLQATWTELSQANQDAFLGN